MTPDRDLHWTAARYLLDELSPAEAEAFEACLADDQEAREALAAAVELHGAIFHALPAVSHRRARSRRRVAVGLVTAMAASIVGWMVFVPHKPDSPMARDRDAAEVALAWADSRGLADPDIEPIDETEASELADADDDPAVPAWMFEAVSHATDGEAPVAGF